MSGDKLPIVERLEFELRDWREGDRCHFPSINALTIRQAATTITELVSALEEARNVLHDALMPDGIYPQDAEPVIAEINTLIANTRGDTK